MQLDLDFPVMILVIWVKKWLIRKIRTTYKEALKLLIL